MVTVKDREETIEQLKDDVNQQEKVIEELRATLEQQLTSLDVNQDKRKSEKYKLNQ